MRKYEPKSTVFLPQIQIQLSTQYTVKSPVLNYSLEYIMSNYRVLKLILKQC